MNLQELFTMQLELDNAIGQKAKAKDPSWNADEMLKQGSIAILVELAEFANEIQTFKYWKQNKTVNKDLVLEEYADILHFLISYSNHFKSESEIKILYKTRDVNQHILDCFSIASKWSKNPNKRVLKKLFGYILGFITILNMSEQEVVAAYKAKNRKNHERLKNNY
ncbi:dUTP diphosphatase [Mycoplasma sp. Ms02]|uniref:dUTP diphosphatase n=1 Tax=Mycoplasma sp. Ms02 TaxID=353851 RepID=UPI001C8A4C35|nr:dUTP diphosphatase [Mycoplasma sp. Ms02]QZE12241.1 dUTP diphosphatase [Mycoplasma sp. Ms02]